MPGGFPPESFLPPPASESPRCASPVPAEIQSLLPLSHGILPCVSGFLRLSSYKDTSNSGSGSPHHSRMTSS